MERTVQHLGGRSAFHDAAGIHDGDIIGIVGHQAQIMRDQQDGKTERLLQPRQHVEDFALHGDVQRRGGFIGDQHPGPPRHGDGDQHALAHAARQAVGKFPHQTPGIGQPHQFQQFAHPCIEILAGQFFVRQHRFAQLAADAHHGIERALRFLEDHGNLAAADFPQTAVAHFCQVAAVEPDAAFQDA